MERQSKPRYYPYNVDFAQRRGIVASILMGRIIFEMKINLPKLEFVFDIARASAMYTDEIYNEMETLISAKLIVAERIDDYRYLVRVTKYGIYEFVYNVFEYTKD